MENEPAPYAGIIVPFETYRKQNADILERDLLKEKFKNCVPEPKQESTDWDMILKIFGVGFISGMAASLYLRK